jgi:6-pyruvoyl-tetrahydropterin synthase
MFFRKGYNRTFIGYIHNIKGKYGKKEMVRPTSHIDGNSAVMSLSIKGDKQTANVICLKIKNKESMNNEFNHKIIKEITSFAEDKKATTYENGEYIFFILAPSITRTFRNEPITLEIAKEIKNRLTSYNRLAQEKIEFGIGLNYGDIIAKKEDVLKFMSLGTFITAVKKVATESDQEVLLTKEMDMRLKNLGGIRTEKKVKKGVELYRIKEIRDTGKDEKFINNFLESIKEDKKRR